MEQFKHREQEGPGGRVNAGFEDINDVVGEKSINNVTVNAAKDLTVDLSTKINIPSDTIIHDDIKINTQTNLHLWLCPSKVYKYFVENTNMTYG